MATPIATLKSQTHYTADGTTTLWDFSFAGGYLSKDHVRAYKRDPGGVRTEIPLVASNFVTDTRLLVTGIPAGWRLVIYRATPTDRPLVDWQNSAWVARPDLDTTAKQAVFAAAEAADLYGATTEADLVAISQQASLAQAAAVSAAATAATSASNASASATAASTTVAALNNDLLNGADPSKGAGQVGYLGTLNYVAGTVGKFLKDLTSSAGSSLLGFLQAGTGTSARTVQDKLRDFEVHAKDFGAKFDGTTNDAAAIQAAINHVSAAGGGRVRLSVGVANIGSGNPAISCPDRVGLIGAGDAYTNPGVNGKGTELLYFGTGTALSFQGINMHSSDFSVRAAAASGTSLVGIKHDGGWLSSYRRISIKGIPEANGFTFQMTSGPVSYGSYVVELDHVNGSGGAMSFAGRNASDGITTLTIKNCMTNKATFSYAQGVWINGAVEVWTTGSGMSFSNNCYFTLLGVDIEGAGGGAGTAGIKVDATSVVFEQGTIWAGYTGANRVLGTLATRQHGPVDIQQQMTQGSSVKVGQVGQQAVGNSLLSNFVSDWVFPKNLVGGSQTAYRQQRHLRNGVDVLDHDWEEHAFIKKAISTSATSAITLFTIPVPINDGLRVSAHAHGSQAGDGAYSNSRDCHVSNNGGTLTITQGTQVTAGAACSISYVISGTNLLVNWTPTTANASSGSVNLEVRGAWSNYS
jgi:hypothetical protein